MTNAPAQPVQAALEKLRAIAADTGWHPDYRRGLYDAITAVSVALPREAPAAVAEAALHHVTGERITRKDLNNAYRMGCENGRLAAHHLDGIASPAPAPEAPAGWQDISTAARNHFPILTWSLEQGQAVAFLDVAWSWWSVPNGDGPMRYAPSHWRPLAPSPNARATQADDTKGEA